MLPSELIGRKRDGEELTPSEVREFFDLYAAGEVADHQVSALLMAVCIRGLSEAELSALTRTMIESGTRLDFRDGGPPAVDKHSTGGVGDKVSLVLAPLVAEAGLRVPMMSGRGLGHTGGTLDKLEAIPGFRTGLDLDEFRAVLADVGCAMIGQTEEIAPLDGRLYALRDVTGTVPSIPLIASSIVSKKVAEGIEVLVLDVKFGRGAFMREAERAIELGRVMVGLAGREGVRTTALLTDMEHPLGRAVGNALEVREAVDCLHGAGPPDLREVTLALGAELLVGAGEADDRAAAAATLAALLDDGRAAERFSRLIERQGGDPRVVEDPDRLPAAPVRSEVTAPRAGRIAAVDARALGLTAVELGAGRRRLGAAVDPAVGIEVRVRPGDEVRAGDPVATVHARDGAAAAAAAERIRAALSFRAEAGDAGDGDVEAVVEGGDAGAANGTRVRGRITPDGFQPLPAP